jgi:hypothetical protein
MKSDAGLLTVYGLNWNASLSKVQIWSEQYDEQHCHFQATA